MRALWQQETRWTNEVEKEGRTMQDNPHTQPRGLSETQPKRFGNIVFICLGATLLLPILVVTRAATEGTFPAEVAAAMITSVVALGATMIFHGAKRSKASLLSIVLVFAVILLLAIGAFVAGYDF